MAMERWSDDPLWECGDPSDEAIVLFTEGECWALAWHVAKLTGGTIHTLGTWPSWDHVVVRVGPDAFLDIEGVHTRTELRRRWMINRVVPMDASSTSTLGAYTAALQAAFAFQIAHGEILGVAEGLVAKWLTNDRLPVAV